MPGSRSAALRRFLLRSCGRGSGAFEISGGRRQPSHDEARSKPPKRAPVALTAIRDSLPGLEPLPGLLQLSSRMGNINVDQAVAASLRFGAAG